MVKRDPRPGWIPLAETDRIDTPTCGAKAHRLALLARAGMPVAAGWSLPHDDAAAALRDASRREELARSLLTLHPTPRWLLRSSSPFEDLPGRSAAGLFASLSAESVPEDLTAALEEVAASGARPEVMRLLRRSDPVPVAVLAQPHLPLDGWWTVELHAPTGEGQIEGWTAEDGFERTVRGDLGLVPSLRSVLDAFRRWSPEGIWLLEVGRASGALHLLQARPAPPRRATWPTPMAAPVPERDDVPWFPLHPGDSEADWVWDGAHSPSPLCPLLAGIFHRWLSERPRWPSRLIHGRWFDRSSSLPRKQVSLETAPFERQRRDLLGLLDELRDLVAALPTSDPHSAWASFVARWLRLQERYYDEECAAARSTAREVASQRAAGGAPLLARSTIAERRGQELDALARDLRGRRRWTSPGELETWYAAEGHDDLRDAIHAFLDAHGHVAALPWDGRSRPWSEDRIPMWRDLLRRMDAPAQAILPQEERDDPASRILVHAEDDDDLLAQAYALWRAAARIVASSLGVSPRADEQVFDLLPLDLEAQLASPDPMQWEEAWRRGRSLAQRWAAWEPERAEERASTRHGVAASPGRGVGPVRRLTAALADGGPRVGEILVVPTILPADAIVFDRIAGLVVEQGEALGHAAILARESGVPAVVGLAGARRWLACTERVLVDGDLGTVTRLETSGGGTDEPA